MKEQLLIGFIVTFLLDTAFTDVTLSRHDVTPATEIDSAIDDVANVSQRFAVGKINLQVRLQPHPPLLNQGQTGVVLIYQAD